MVMKQDSKGIPDVCRETPHIPSPEMVEHLKFVKIQTNAMIHHLRVLQEVNNTDPGVGRHLALAVSAYEEGALWAVKGLSSEGVKP